MLRICSILIAAMIAGCGGFSKGDHVAVFEEVGDITPGYIEAEVQEKDDSNYIVRIIAAHNDWRLTARKGSIVSIPAENVFSLKDGVTISDKRKELLGYLEDSKLNDINLERVKSLGRAAHLPHLDELLGWIEASRSLRTQDSDQILKAIDTCSDLPEQGTISNSIKAYVKAGKSYASAVAEGMRRSHSSARLYTVLPAFLNVNGDVLNAVAALHVYSVSCGKQEADRSYKHMVELYGFLSKTSGASVIASKAKGRLRDAVQAAIKNQISNYFANNTIKLEALLAGAKDTGNYSEIKCNPEKELDELVSRYGIVADYFVMIPEFSTYQDSCKNAQQEKMAYILGQLKEKIAKDGSDGTQSYINRIADEQKLSDAEVAYLADQANMLVSAKKFNEARQKKVMATKKMAEATRWFGFVGLNKLYEPDSFLRVSFSQGSAEAIRVVQNPDGSSSFVKKSFKFTPKYGVGFVSMSIGRHKLELKVSKSFLATGTDFRLLPEKRAKSLARVSKRLGGDWKLWDNPPVRVTLKKLEDCAYQATIKGANGAWRGLIAPMWNSGFSSEPTLALVTSVNYFQVNSKGTEIRANGRPVFYR